MEIGSGLIGDTVVAAAFTFRAEYWQIISGIRPVAHMFDDGKRHAIDSGLKAVKAVASYGELYGW